MTENPLEESGETPLWMIEDRIVLAKRAAQHGNKQECKEILEETLTLFDEE